MENNNYNLLSYTISVPTLLSLIIHLKKLILHLVRTKMKDNIKMNERKHSVFSEFEANTLLPFNLNPNTESCIIYLKNKER